MALRLPTQKIDKHINPFVLCFCFPGETAKRYSLRAIAIKFIRNAANSSNRFTKYS